MLILSLYTKFAAVWLKSRSMKGIINPIENRLNSTNNNMNTLASKSGFE